MLAYCLLDSPSVAKSAWCASLRREEPEMNMSLNNGSLKQLLPVSSKCWHRSNVRLTKVKAAFLAILLLALFPPEALDPRQVC